MPHEFVEVRSRRSGAVHRPKLGPIIQIQVPALGLKFYRHDTAGVFVEVYRADKHLRTLEMDDERLETFRKTVREFVLREFPSDGPE